MYKTDDYTICDRNGVKVFQSPNYNYIFRRDNGYFARWGNIIENDPEWCQFGPEILDLEISTGECMGRCAFCYKSNGTPRTETKHMSFKTFTDILSRMPPTLTQIAFGITNVKANPDFRSMLEQSRSIGVIPNYTTHGLDIDEEWAEITKKNCGAVAVSILGDQSFDAVKLFTDQGMDQVNIHCMISKERMKFAHQLIDEIRLDPRLEKVNAIVFLQYKPKGNNKDRFNCPSVEDFKTLVEHCEQRGIGFGFDSCSAPMYLECIKDSPYYKQMSQYAEPCESGLFSSYINVDGDFYVCSFAENGVDKIPVLEYNEFIEVWNHPNLQDWRRRLLENKRSCPIYPLGV